MKRIIKGQLLACLLLAVSAGPAAAGGQRLDVTRLGARGDAVTDDGPAIRHAVAAAIAAGPGSVLSFPKRVYRLDALNGASAQITLDGVRELTIDGNGSTLLLHPRGGAFSLKQCRNVTVRGFTIEYDPLPFTQGAIRAVDAAQGAFDLEIQRGYPLPPADALVKEQLGPAGWQYGVVMDPVARHRRWGVRDHFYLEAVHAVAGQPRLFRIKVAASCAPGLAAVTPGDRFFLPLLLLEGVRTGGVNFGITESADCLIENITFHSGRNGMVFSVARNEGRITLRGNRICFKPGDPNITTAWKDGMHCKDNRIGPLIENCFFEGMQDDSINLSANTAMAVQQLAPAEFILTRTRFGPGDRVMVVDPKSGRVLAETRVVSARPQSGSRYRVALADAVSSVVTGQMIPHRDIRATHFYNMSYANEKFVVRGCTFLPQRRHALLVRSCQGLIEGNTVRGVGGAAVWMGNEIGSFYEGPFPRGNVIRNNTIQDTQLPPIQISSQLLTAQARLTGEIRVEHNTIRVLPGQPGIRVQAAENVELIGNQIEDGASKPLGPEAVKVVNSRGVRIR